MKNQVENIAAIDMGSNSFHMIVAHLTPQGHIQIIDSYKETIRLGQALTEDGELTDEAISQAVATLIKMKQIAACYNAHIRAVATHAARSASNQEALLDAVSQATGIEVEIIDGQEEARLTYLGIQSGLSLDNATILGLDVGGGSTEVIVARGEEILYVSSLKLGTVNLSHQFFNFKAAKPQNLRRMRQHITGIVSPIVEELRSYAFTRAIATSGTAKAMAGIHYQMTSHEDLGDANGYEIDASGVVAVESRLAKLSQPEKIRQEFDLDRKRSEIILAGSLMIRTMTELAKIPGWLVSINGFKEGIVLDTYDRLRPSQRLNGKDIREESVKNLAQTLNLDRPYAETVKRLAQTFFSELKRQGLVREKGLAQIKDERLLSAACDLWETGRFINDSQFHKHSWYIISQTNSLLGFSQEEKQIIAYITRYGRKKIAPQDSARDNFYFKKNFQRINTLSSCLRLAQCLNSSRQNRISDITLQSSAGTLTVTALYNGENFPEVESQALERERNNLSKALGIAMQYEFRPSST